MNGFMRVVLAMTVFFSASSYAGAEIKVVPTEGSNGSSVEGAAKKGSAAAPGQSGVAKNAQLPHNYSGKPFGTFRSSNHNHDSKKQKSGRALFRADKNDTSKWY